jgi:hypothetical protein
MPNRDPDPISPEDLGQVLDSMRRRLGRLTVAVVLMALALFLTAAVVHGQLSNYFAGQATLVGGVAVAAALVGFGLGWFAGRKT